MYCPVCKDKELVMSERQGIEIDYCPQCRGVWLDRGELDKIIQHSVRDLSAASAAPSGYPPPQQQSYPQHKQQRHYDDERRDQHKKKSFWEDLFD